MESEQCEWLLFPALAAPALQLQRANAAQQRELKDLRLSLFLSLCISLFLTILGYGESRKQEDENAAKMISSEEQNNKRVTWISCGFSRKY